MPVGDREVHGCPAELDGEKRDELLLFNDTASRLKGVFKSTLPSAIRLISRFASMSPVNAGSLGSNAVHQANAAVAETLKLWLKWYLTETGKAVTA